MIQCSEKKTGFLDLILHLIDFFINILATCPLHVLCCRKVFAPILILYMFVTLSKFNIT